MSNAIVPFGYNFTVSDDNGGIVSNPFSELVCRTGAHSISAALDKAGLNFEVEKQKIYTENGQLIKDSMATVNSSTGQVYGIVGSKYEILQNRKAFEWFAPFVDYGLEIQNAGSLGNGAIVFIQASLGELTVGKGDNVNKLLTITHSHNGRYSVMTNLTPVRIVCQNTFVLSRNSKYGANSVLANIKHTQSMHYKLEQVQSCILQLNDIYSKQLEAFKFLASTRINNSQADGYFRKALGIAESDDSKLHRKTLNTLNRVKGLYLGLGRGSDLETARGTVYGAWNALAEYATWEQGRSQEARLESLWMGNGKKEFSLEYALDFATAV